MAVYNLGRVLPLFKGDYVNGTTYTKLDCVYVGGYGTYVALDKNDESPVDSSYWTVIAKDGEASGGGISEAKAREIIEAYNYVTNSELDAKGYLTEIPSEYVTDSELEAKGYITEIPSEYITETELEGKGYATESELEKKQDKLVSGTNIKTINNQSILGEGNIEVESGGVTEDKVKEIVEGYDYTTMDEVEAKDYVDNTTLNSKNYTTMAAVEAKGYLTEVPSEYITESELEAKNYTTMADVEAKGYITEVPDEYITETELESKDYATESELDNKQDTLVSGTNIKTINNQSILGSGNIEVEGTGTADNFIINTSEYSADVYSQLDALWSDESYWDRDKYTFYIEGVNTKHVQYIDVFYKHSNGSFIAEYYYYADGITTRMTTILKADGTFTTSTLATLAASTNVKTINNESIIGSGNIEISGGSANTVKLTQEEYDALETKDDNVIYIISDATPETLDDYYTKSEADETFNPINNTTAYTEGYNIPYWNSKGQITGKAIEIYQSYQEINGDGRTVYTTSSSDMPTIYAPTTAGTAGQVLTSNGSGAPTWTEYKSDATTYLSLAECTAGTYSTTISEFYSDCIANNHIGPLQFVNEVTQSDSTVAYSYYLPSSTRLYEGNVELWLFTTEDGKTWSKTHILITNTAVTTDTTTGTFGE